MNSNHRIILGNEAWNAVFDAEDQERLVLEYGGEIALACGGVICDKFDEGDGLIKINRVHEKADALSANVEVEMELPFGSEYQVFHDYEMADGFCQVTEDIQGRLKYLRLPDVGISGELAQVVIYTADEAGKIQRSSFDLTNEVEVFYNSDKPLLMFSVVGKSGKVFDCGCGSDFWRHGIGSTPEISGAEFRLAGDCNDLLFERVMFALPEDAEVLNRPWRFKWFFAWHDAENAEKFVSSRQQDFGGLQIAETGLIETADGGRISDVCINSAPARRAMRKLVRSAATGETLLLTEFDPAICFDASHLNRSGKEQLAHWEIDDAFSFYLWANRTLLRQDGAFAFAVKAGNIFTGTAFMGRVTGLIGKVEIFNGREEDELPDDFDENF